MRQLSQCVILCLTVMIGWESRALGAGRWELAVIRGGHSLSDVCHGMSKKIIQLSNQPTNF